LIEAIVATNREYTQDTIVENASGNMVPAVITSNHLTTEMDNMYADLEPRKDGSVMSKEDFIKKYSHITGSRPYRKTDAQGNFMGNHFLDFYYDSVMKGSRPGITYYTGINDTVSNRANEYDGSTSYEQSFENFMMYMDNPKATSYMADVGTFGD